jgi:hypothetical protein
MGQESGFEINIMSEKGLVLAQKEVKKSGANLM